MTLVFDRYSFYRKGATAITVLTIPPTINTIQYVTFTQFIQSLLGVPHFFNPHSTKSHGPIKIFINQHRSLLFEPHPSPAVAVWDSSNGEAEPL
jgi:hypothetical protein